MTSTSPKAGAGLLRDTRRNIAAATALLSAVVMFFVAEIVSAAAWHSPAYSYANDFVSDLGVPGPLVMFKGHPIYSPLAWLLDAGFVADGVLVAVAAVLLLRPAGQGRMAAWQRRLGIGFGIGLTMAALLHESPAWSLPFHALERGAAYPVLATQLIVGVGLLVESARLRKRSVQAAGRAATIAA